MFGEHRIEMKKDQKNNVTSVDNFWEFKKH